MAGLDDTPVALDAHAMNPMRVLALARSMGADLKNIVIVGCEPETLGAPDEGQLGLSSCVAGAVESALEVVESLIAKHKDTQIQGARI